MIDTVVKNLVEIKELHNFAAKKEVNDAMSCSKKDLDKADAENPAENDVVERLSAFYSDKEVNDGEICLKNDAKAEEDEEEISVYLQPEMCKEEGSVYLQPGMCKGKGSIYLQKDVDYVN